MTRKVRFFTIALCLLITSNMSAQPQPLLIEYDTSQRIACYVGIENQKPICITLQDFFYPDNVPLWNIVSKSEIKIPTHTQIIKNSWVSLQLDKSKEYLACDKQGCLYFSSVENEETVWQEIIHSGYRAPIYASGLNRNLFLLEQLLKELVE